ncbi:uncharacterized protein Gasu_08310 [Galdieria sulphuraria]|uniref:Nitric oxide synthase-interacting protein zinc-finger domain-containing protein n=1 Tax=Galdieria sulphuraria TaxID=130081 RepID=M2Y7N6_GALSU|nr:uncharacterized protein Gasu_08310 [Galdieria sulphuraria]EME32088.1 hypothetical protein Gasu_08310 [Galdieria sulphuraria]|eukprot:XP_005708608.1 hypothetical protein Gasu_08310 [Galdieria sulphuraria]
MTRHSKHSYDSAVFSYHEKKKMGYGSKTVVLSSETIRPFDCCCLSLQPSKDPVVTPEGFLYDREAILEHLLNQKRSLKKVEENERKRKLASKLQKERLEQEEQRERIEEFERKARGLSNTVKKPKLSDSFEGKDFGSSNCWLPESKVGQKEEIVVDGEKGASIKYTCCPMSGKPLKAKDLITVKFTLAAEKEQHRVIEKYGKNEWQYMCPVCYVGLSNAVKCAVLRDSGDVICAECVERFAKRDSKNPVTDSYIDPIRDVIFLQTEGTGYAATSLNKLEQRKVAPAARV